MTKYHLPRRLFYRRFPIKKHPFFFYDLLLILIPYLLYFAGITLSSFKYLKNTLPREDFLCGAAGLLLLNIFYLLYFTLALLFIRGCAELSKEKKRFYTSEIAFAMFTGTAITLGQIFYPY